MQKLTFITYITFTILLSSCGWRVFVNGQGRPYSQPPSTRDSVLTVSGSRTVVFSNAVPLHDSATVVAHLIIKASFQNFVSYEELVTRARTEAARMGGNEMKIEQLHGLAQIPWLWHTIYTTVYRLNAADLTRVRAEVEAADKHFTDSIRRLAIVHIRDHDQQGHRTLYFNDSLVTRLHGVGFDGLRNPGEADLVFHEPGVLTLVPDSTTRLNIATGKEYFIFLYTETSRRGYRYVYRLLDTNTGISDRWFQFH